jgi:two-component system cell cycle response regulator
VSLRARLTLLVCFVLALPLVAVVLLARDAAAGEARARAAAELDAAAAAVPAAYRAWQARAADLVRGATGLLARPEHAAAFRDPSAAERLAAAGRGSLSLFAVVSSEGRVLAVSAVPARLLAGASPPGPAAVVAARDASRAVLAEAVVVDPAGEAGSLVGGFWLDEAFLEGALPDGADALLLVDGEAVASTRGEGRLAGRQVVAVERPVLDGVPASRLAVLVAADRSAALAGPGLAAGLWVAAALAVAGGALLAWWVAGLVTRPLSQMAEAAQTIARGNVAGSLEVPSSDEVGRLAAAFNEVLARMQARLAELAESRDQVRRSVERLGEVLRSTHDLTKLLSVVLDTALAAVQARAGAVFLLTPSRMEVALRVSRRLEAEPDARLRLGEGVAGTVAATRRAALVPSDREALAPAAFEPREPTALAVPIESETQLLGVIALYGRTAGGPFEASDLEVVRSLARQAAVGVENVLLHQEAQRLSITDGLTSLWNYRYMNMRLAQEVERAIRFRRPLSVLVLDIDHFKQINDRYGHQRGDAILAEIANRIVSETRAQVDTVARYGGEEFVLILPETPLEGALVVAGKVREAIALRPFGGEGEEPITVTVSVGVAAFPQHGTTAPALLRAADQALYEAKGRGRNRVVTADELDRRPPVAGEEPRP